MWVLISGKGLHLQDALKDLVASALCSALQDVCASVALEQHVCARHKQNIHCLHAQHIIMISHWQKVNHGQEIKAAQIGKNQSCGSGPLELGLMITSCVDLLILLLVLLYTHFLPRGKVRPADKLCRWQCVKPADAHAARRVAVQCRRLSLRHSPHRSPQAAASGAPLCGQNRLPGALPSSLPTCQCARGSRLSPSLPPPLCSPPPPHSVALFPATTHWSSQQAAVAVYASSECKVDQDRISGGNTSGSFSHEWESLEKDRRGTPLHPFESTGSILQPEHQSLLTTSAPPMAAARCIAVRPP